MGMNKIAIITVGLLLLCACNRPECQNTNPVFEQNKIDSKAYLEELVKEIGKRDPKDLRYWMDVWEVRDHQKYMIVHVQGDGLCAKAFLTIPPDEAKDTDLAKDRQFAGGWRGAEIVDLEFDVVQEGAGPVLLFRGYDHMID
jgi:hypothetical protein